MFLHPKPMRFQHLFKKSKLKPNLLNNEYQDSPIVSGKLKPLYFRQELIDVQVTCFPCLRVVHFLSSSEIYLVSDWKLVVASITATGRDLKTITLFDSYAPTTKSGYKFPSKSIPPEMENPKVDKYVEPLKSSAKITCECFSRGPVGDPW